VPSHTGEHLSDDGLGGMMAWAGELSGVKTHRSTCPGVGGSGQKQCPLSQRQVLHCDSEEKQAKLLRYFSGKKEICFQREGAMEGWDVPTLPPPRG
jgi:hypothetical protein